MNSFEYIRTIGNTQASIDVMPGTRLMMAWGSFDDDDGIDEEDKTVTARPRRGPLGKRTPPCLAPLLDAHSNL